MKIVVVGAGAMGSIYAALLADAGHAVWVIDPWQAHTTTIASNGLRVEGASGDRCIKSIGIINRGDEIPQADLFIIATKASAVSDAAQLISTALNSNAKVLTIQNGMGSGQRAAEHINSNQLFIGVADGFGASVKAPGHIHHTTMKLIRIGAYSNHNAKDTENLVSIWRRAGFNAQAYSDIEQLIWEKFICNVAYSAPCTVFGKSVKELLENPQARGVSQQCATEAWQVAKHRNINLSFDDPVQYITEFGLKVGDAKPSMLLDHLSKRRSEIDAINAMVPVLAKEDNLVAPYNEVVTAIVVSRENDWN